MDNGVIKYRVRYSKKGDVLTFDAYVDNRWIIQPIHNVSAKDDITMEWFEFVDKVVQSQ